MGKLTAALPGGEVLIIVPPNAPERSAIGPHSLQAYAKKSGVDVRVFYGNLDYACMIGLKNYSALSGNLNVYDPADSISERPFVASAYGLPPLGFNADRIFDEDGAPNRAPDRNWIPSEPVLRRRYLDRTAGQAANIELAELRRLESKTEGWLKRVAGAIIDKGFRIVGCSTTFSALAASIALLRVLKRMNPDVITVLGGAKVAAEMARGAASIDSTADYIFDGEAENAFSRFILNAREGKLPENKVVHCDAPMNLDDLPAPDYTDYFNQFDLFRETMGIEHSPLVVYETSRSCRWGKCRFCGFDMERAAYREKSPGKVFEELKELKETHDINRALMSDMTMPVSYLDTLLPRLERENPGIDIFYELKSDLSLQQVLSLKRAGVRNVQPGIEALAPSLLRKMKKGVLARQNIAFLRYARIAEIEALWFLIFGLPGDDPDAYQRTLELLPQLRHLEPPVRLLPLGLFRFSDYINNPDKFGLKDIRAWETYKEILPPEADPEQIAYIFTSNYSSGITENPEVLVSLCDEVFVWSRPWGFYKKTGIRQFLPVLHVERLENDAFLLRDTRGLPGTEKETVIDRERARISLVARSVGDGIPSDIRWALSRKLGALIDSRYIPFATASPEIALEFEGEGF